MNKPVKPPKIAAWLLERITEGGIRHAAMGDFEEKFNWITENYSPYKAIQWYWFQIIISFPRFISDTCYWRIIMIKSYLKIAVRNLTKRKANALINISGLALGVSFSILAFLFARNEFTYDTFHENAENIYKINVEWPGRVYGITPIPLAPALADAFPEISQALRIRDFPGTVRSQGNSFSERLHYIDKEVFEIFTFRLIQGNREQALTQPNSVVITESMAQKYFPDRNAMGKTLEIQIGDEFREFIVTAIAEDTPSNSSIEFNIVLSFEQVPVSPDHFESFDVNRIFSYVVINKASDIRDLETKSTEFFLERIPQDENGPRGIRLQNITKLHFDRSILFTGFNTVSDPSYSYILSGVALMVLFIACFNFMILAVGSSSVRLKEVGMRKVMGATRGQVMVQFWGESFILSTLSLFLGIILVNLMLPVFNVLANKQLALSALYDPLTIAIFVALLVGVGFISGSYPALLLSRFRPIASMRRRHKIGTSNIFGRLLVVSQFTLSIILISGTLVMYNQLHFLKNKNLGFDGEQVIVIRTNPLDETGALQNFRSELLSRSEIVNISGSSYILGGGGGWGNQNVTVDGKTLRTLDFKIDTDYIQTMGMEILDGRNLSEEFASDPASSVLVNETFVKQAGWENPIGQVLNFRGTRTVVGVVKDFHFRSLHEKISPLLLHNIGWQVGSVSILVNTENIQETLRKIEDTWSAFFPSQDFDYFFLDEHMDSLYANEERWGTIVTYASIFAVLLAAMGLLGLTALIVSQRTKEIGIRKVLGASTSSVANLLSGDFLGLVIIANMIAAPVGYELMKWWIKDFPYQAPLDVSIFLYAALISIFITVFTVSFQTLRAALQNAVNVLRYE